VLITILVFNSVAFGIKEASKGTIYEWEHWEFMGKLFGIDILIMILFLFIL
jgi:uncharacterized membrane protein